MLRRTHMLAASAAIAAATAAAPPAAAAPPGTSFTYQGMLTNGGSPVNATVSVTFRLFGDEIGGTQVGSDIVESITPADGVFSQTLDFGVNAWTSNEALWLEIEVNGDLLGRQKIEGAPYALNTRGLSVAFNGNVGINGAAEVDARLAVTATDPFFGTVRFMHNEFGPGAEMSFDGGLDGGAGIRNITPGGRTEFFGPTGVTPILSLNNNGNVGIRTSSPEGLLDVQGSAGGRYRVFDFSGFGGMRLVASLEGGGLAPQLRFEEVESSPSYIDIGQDASEGFVIETSDIPRLTVRQDGRILIGTSTLGSSKVRVASDQNIGILVEGGAGAAGLIATTLHEFGNAVIGEAFSTTGQATGVLGISHSAAGWDFFAGGAGINYGSTSSRRWKHNIELISDALAKVTRLRGVSFDWDEAHGGTRDVGMIAEEVGRVLPEIVGYEENGVDAIGMDYTKLTPLLVEAVRALRAEKDAQIQDLQLRLAACEARLDAAGAPSMTRASLAWPALAVLGFVGLAAARRRRSGDRAA